MCTKISGRLEFNPLASRLMHLWDWVQAMGGDLTRASEKFDQGSSIFTVDLLYKVEIACCLIIIKCDFLDVYVLL